MKKLAVVLLSLTCFASPVSAGCAWVLWEDKIITTETKSGDFTNILGSAFSSLKDCEAALQRYMRADLAQGNKIHEPQVTLWRSEDGKRTIITRYRCLPDTIDPRGVKGGKP